MWQKPGTMQTPGSPTHKVPAHPGADDDTDDEELNQMDEEQPKPEKSEKAEKPDTVEPKLELIKNLIDDPVSETDDSER